MEYKSVKDTAARWKISDRRVRILCQQGKIEGAFQKGRVWFIPENTEKPKDGRHTRHKVCEGYYSFKQIYDIYKKKQKKAGTKPIDQYRAKNACIDILNKVGLDCDLLKEKIGDENLSKIKRYNALFGTKKRKTAQTSIIRAVSLTELHIQRIVPV